MEVSSLVSDFLDGDERRSCAMHGNYRALRIKGRWSSCPLCVKANLDEEDRAQTNLIRQEQESIRKRKMIEASGIPHRFLEKRLGNFVVDNEGQRVAFETAVNYVKNFADALTYGRGMIFAGLPGTGKTHLAVAIALDVMEQGHSALYTSVLRALRSVKDGFSSTGETETAVVKKLAVPDLLVMDEAGITYETDTEAMILYEIVNQRYEEGKPTIFTSNYNMEELQKVMGARVIDRLREGGGMAVQFNWDSWRARRSV